MPQNHTFLVKWEGPLAAVVITTGAMGEVK